MYSLGLKHTARQPATAEGIAMLHSTAERTMQGTSMSAITFLPALERMLTEHC